MAVRSRYAEDALGEAVASGVRQYVLLGAGLDTFAYRNPYAAEGLRVFEVDHPATQQWKRDRLQQVGIAIPTRSPSSPSTSRARPSVPRSSARASIAGSRPSSPGSA